MEHKPEYIEWSQMWTENTARDKDRVLLIGDSISVGYRSHVHRRIKDRYYVTAISTSKALDNPYFLDEIRLFSKEEGYEYKVVQFNNGLHGFHLSDGEYERLYRDFVAFLKKTFPHSKIVLALSTPHMRSDDNTAYDEKNGIVLNRNEAVKRIAKDENLDVIDLYSVVDGKPEYGKGDGVHYNESGYVALADKIADTLLKI